MNVSNIGRSTSVVANELHCDPDEFQTFHRLGKSNFNKSVHSVGPNIFKSDTNFRLSVPSVRKNFSLLRLIVYQTRDLFFGGVFS